MASGPSESFAGSRRVEDSCSWSGSTLAACFLEGRGLLDDCALDRSGAAGFSWAATLLKQTKKIAHDSKKAHCDADLKSLIDWPTRSEEHTSELQSQSNLVCRLL